MIKRKIILLPQEYVVLVDFGYLVYVFLVLLFQETFRLFGFQICRP